jgi:hypothetical protein
MSEAQFAEMITSWNMAEGTPVTIDNIEGNQIPMIDQEEMCVDRVRDDFIRNSETNVQNIRKAKREVSEILEKKSLTKADRDRIREAIRKVEAWTIDSAPYFSQLFEEAAERTVSAAKVEINTFVNNAAMIVGMEQAQKLIDCKQNEKITDGNVTKTEEKK